MSIYCNTGVDFFFSVFVTALNSPLDFNTSGFFFPLKAKLISAKLKEFFLSILKLWRFRKPRYIFLYSKKIWIVFSLFFQTLKFSFHFGLHAVIPSVLVGPLLPPTPRPTAPSSSANHVVVLLSAYMLQRRQ